MSLFLYTRAMGFNISIQTVRLSSMGDIAADATPKACDRTDILQSLHYYIIWHLDSAMEDNLFEIIAVWLSFLGYIDLPAVETSCGYTWPMTTRPMN